MTTLSIGVITPSTDPESFARIRELGMTTCQVSVWDRDVSEENAAQVREAAASAGITISSVWCECSGPAVWDFVEGPATIGLVPAQYRAQRLQELKRCAEFTAWLGVDNAVTHAGFLPVDPEHPDYIGTVEALKELVDHCAERGLWLCLETGQETPVALRRCMHDIGRDNLGVNFDPANLLMYGNANPIDALDLLGPFVRDVHAKDGDYPTSGRELGPEKAMGALTSRRWLPSSSPLATLVRSPSSARSVVRNRSRTLSARSSC
jgi:L-ribulose-5-phosphate 3-epimerase